MGCLSAQRPCSPGQAARWPQPALLLLACLPTGSAAHPVHTPFCLTLCHPGQWHNLPALLTPIGLWMGTRELRG